MRTLLTLIMLLSQPVMASELIDIEPGPTGYVLIGSTVTLPVQVRLSGPADRVRDIRLHCERQALQVPDGRYGWEAYWVPPYPRWGQNQQPESGSFLILDGQLVNHDERESP